MPTTSDGANSNPDSAVYVQAGNGSDWYYLMSADFNSGYAKNSPRDDFAEAMTAYFAQVLIIVGQQCH
mgnify:CR=1 FL=1